MTNQSLYDSKTRKVFREFYLAREIEYVCIAFYVIIILELLYRFV